MGAQENHERDSDYFLREPEVLRRFPVSRSQLWAMIKRGEFPAPVKLSERCSAWANSSLDQHADKLKTGGVKG